MKLVGSHLHMSDSLIYPNQAMPEMGKKGNRSALIYVKIVFLKLVVGRIKRQRIRRIIRFKIK